MGAAPVLLIYGLVGSRREIVPVLAARGISAHAPDLLGYGERRDAAGHGIGLRQQAAHLVRWLNEQGLERVRLVGHLVEGVVAMLLAHEYPARVSSLVSAEENFSLSDAFWSAAVARMGRLRPVR